MLSISPAKILVVLLVALIVFGPDKLPAMARQAGNFLHELRRLRDRVESEMRSVMPEGMPLPSEIVRSPLAFLSSAADRPAGGEGAAAPGGAAAGPDPAGDASPGERDPVAASPAQDAAAQDAAAQDTAAQDTAAQPSYAARPWPGGPPYGGSTTAGGVLPPAPVPRQPDLVIAPGEPELN